MKPLKNRIHDIIEWALHIQSIYALKADYSEQGDSDCII